VDIFARPIAPIYGIENETLAYLSATNGAGKTKAQIAAIDLNIKAIKYAPEGLTLSSVTGKWSLVSGTSFGTGFSQDLRWLSFLQGIQIVANDDTNSMTIIPTYLGYGTGETLTDLIAEWDLTSGWATFAATINDADTFTTAGAGGVRKNIGGAAGALVKLTASYTTTASIVGLMNYGNTASYLSSFVTGGYRTLVDATGIYIRNAAAGQTDITSMSIEQVLTPDTSGFVWTATSVGSFNANAAAFTLTITRIQ
jgi:hypothetical protein